MVQLAARADLEGRAQLRPQGAGAIGNPEARVYPDHAERGWPARPGRQRQNSAAPRRYLAPALHRVRRALAQPQSASAETSAALRLWRPGPPRRDRKSVV